jgi:hypothetical protein
MLSAPPSFFDAQPGSQDAVMQCRNASDAQNQSRLPSVAPCCTAALGSCERVVRCTTPRLVRL